MPKGSSQYLRSWNDDFSEPKDYGVPFANIIKAINEGLLLNSPSFFILVIYYSTIKLEHPKKSERKVQRLRSAITATCLFLALTG